MDDATRLHHLADEAGQVRVDRRWPSGGAGDGTDLLGLGRSIRPSYDSNTIILESNFQTKVNSSSFYLTFSTRHQNSSRQSVVSNYLFCFSQVHPETQSQTPTPLENFDVNQKCF